MARAAERAESLAEDDAGMESAMETVLGVADRKGVVTWTDVSDELTSGEWGRLIEQEILIDADGEGFVVDDPEGVREAIGADEPESTGSSLLGGSESSGEGSDTESSPDGESDTDDDGGWSTWDKLAGVLTVALFLGYSQAPVRNTVGNALDIVLGPLASTLPFYVMIMVLAVFTGINSTILREKLMDMDKMAEYQAQMQEIQEKRKKAKERGDDEALDRIQDEQMDAMGDQLGMFKEQFRPMVWIMLVNIPVFLWIYWMVRTPELIAGSGPVMILPLIGEVASWKDRIGPMWSWLIWYFVCSMSFTQIVQKALDVQMSPGTS